MSCHDLIIGDFGRVGTLRYLEQFSRIEQQRIETQLDSAAFFDEYRQVRYTVIGALRDIKRDLLAPLETAGEALDERVLVGMASGVDPTRLVYQLRQTITPYLELALANPQVTRIRVLIPCNTMASAARALQQYYDQLAHLPGQPSHRLREVRITVPTLPAAVWDYLQTIGLPEKLVVLGTPTAVAAYIHEAQTRQLKVHLEPWHSSAGHTSEQVILACVRGEPLPPLDPDNTLILPSSTSLVLSACTDVAIPNTLDSVTIFARQLVNEAYGARP